MPAEGRAAVGPDHRQALVAAQQGNQALQGQHRRLSITAEQQVEAVTVVVGEGLGPQPLQPLKIAAHDLQADARAGGQHQPAAQAGIKQQLPALLATGGQVGAAAQGDHPGAVGPGEGQLPSSCRSIKTGHRGTEGGQASPEPRRLKGLKLLPAQATGPAVAQGNQTRSNQARGRPLAKLTHGFLHSSGISYLACPPGGGQLLQPGGWQVCFCQQQLGARGGAAGGQQASASSHP